MDYFTTFQLGNRPQVTRSCTYGPGSSSKGWAFDRQTVFPPSLSTQATMHITQTYTAYGYKKRWGMMIIKHGPVAVPSL